MDYFCDQCCVKIHKTINKVDVIIINLLVSCLQHTQESFAKATTAKDILENTNVNVIGLSQSEILKQTKHLYNKNMILKSIYYLERVGLIKNNPLGHIKLLTITLDGLKIYKLLNKI